MYFFQISLKYDKQKGSEKQLATLYNKIKIGYIILNEANNFQMPNMPF